MPILLFLLFLSILIILALFHRWVQTSYLNKIKLEGMNNNKKNVYDENFEEPPPPELPPKQGGDDKDIEIVPDFIEEKDIANITQEPITQEPKREGIDMTPTAGRNPFSLSMVKGGGNSSGKGNCAIENPSDGNLSMYLQLPPIQFSMDVNSLLSDGLNNFSKNLMNSMMPNLSSPCPILSDPKSITTPSSLTSPMQTTSQDSNYILKTQIIPPVCPTCVQCSNGVPGGGVCSNCGGNGGSGCNVNGNTWSQGQNSYLWGQTTNPNANNSQQPQPQHQQVTNVNSNSMTNNSQQPQPPANNSQQPPQATTNPSMNQVGNDSGVRSLGNIGDDGIHEIGHDVNRGVRGVGSIVDDGIHEIGHDVNRGVRGVGSIAIDGVNVAGNVAVNGINRIGNDANQGIRGIGNIADSGIRAVGGYADNVVNTIGYDANAVVNTVGKDIDTVVNTVGYDIEQSADSVRRGVKTVGGDLNDGVKVVGSDIGQFFNQVGHVARNGIYAGGGSGYNNNANSGVSGTNLGGVMNYLESGVNQIKNTKEDSTTTPIKAQLTTTGAGTTYPGTTTRGAGTTTTGAGTTYPGTTTTGTGTTYPGTTTTGAGTTYPGTTTARDTGTTTGQGTTSTKITDKFSDLYGQKPLALYKKIENTANYDEPEDEQEIRKKIPSPSGPFFSGMNGNYGNAPGAQGGPKMDPFSYFGNIPAKGWDTNPQPFSF